MNIAFIGCGYVADDYYARLANYPELSLVGVADRDQARATAFGDHHSIPVYSSVAELLADDGVSLVVNLTNPASHFEVSKACLEAGKHVYSEKPLALELEQAKTLARIAAERDLYLSSAPCGLLGGSAQTLWRAIEKQEIGTVGIVYAELDDGPIHLEEPHRWSSRSGAPWPYRDEFEVGCTLEHAGTTRLASAFFGPAQTVTACSACIMPDKQVSGGGELMTSTPDLSVAFITFASGVVARLTCSIVAPYNHAMVVVGERGTLSVDECWHDQAPVKLTRYSKLGFRAAKYPLIRNNPLLGRLFGLRGRDYPAVYKRDWKRRHLAHDMDFARGVAELARAALEKRRCRLPIDYCLHVNEMVLAMHNAGSSGAAYRMTTAFDPLEPDR